MLWVKSFHIVFVMAWMAGLFYLPRIMVHYREGQNADQDISRLVIMAQKLFSFSAIMCVLALGLGIWLWLAWGFSGTWLNLKLGLIGALLIYFVQCYRYIQRMKNGEEMPSSLFFRFFNELALLLVVPIIILVTVKPF